MFLQQDHRIAKEVTFNNITDFYRNMSEHIESFHCH